MLSSLGLRYVLWYCKTERDHQYTIYFNLAPMADIDLRNTMLDP